MISKLVRRNIAATKGRLFLMLLSIVLGVSFVSGSFLLADSLRAIFSDITATAFSGIDAQVRGVEGDLSTGEEAIRISEDIFDTVAALPEVEYAEAGLAAFFQVYTVGADGEVNRPQGPPVFANSWGGPSVASSFALRDGQAPSGNQVAIDATQAETEGLAVGDQVQGSGPGIDELLDMEVSGIVSFGDSDALAGAYFNLFDLPTMQTLMGSPGEIDGVIVNGQDDVSNAELLRAVQAALGDDATLEVVSGTTLIDEQSGEFNEFIDIFGNVLLGFALVVLFVSIFIIYNTFAILISQRIRQFGLLRSIGATGQQLTRMVLIEALIIGIIASIIGLFGGIGIATLLKYLFSQGGGEFPDGPLLFKTRTIIIVFFLGIGVTVGSALLPSFVAQRIPALAALRDGAAATTEGSRHRRVLFGGIVFTLGVALTLFGLFGSLSTAPRLALLGFGAALLFVGVAMLSVLFASAATRFLGAPVEMARGLNGRLARDNASRNPQRTAATASALMIGLALITGVLVLTQSLRASFDKILDETVAADLFIYDDNQGFPFDGAAVAQLAVAPGIDQVAAITSLKVDIDGQVENATGFDVASTDQLLDAQLIGGTYDTGENGVLIYSGKADELNLAIGASINVRFEDDFTDDFTIVGVFDDNTLFGSAWIFDRATTSQHTNLDTVEFVGATFEPGAEPALAQMAAEDAVANFPQLIVQDNSEFKETQEGQINSLLIVVFALLGLCIVVAFIGIVNTMALSILERTREIGLLRAIGTSRRQLRSMVRWEAIIVGVFGALLGVVLGIIIGYAAVSAIPDSFISVVSIPWGWAGIFTIVGGVLGMFAAVLPARRAARMNVLDAISTV
ncbi:MAG: ABC transporter permease [Acidimicrobiaceae bacterium]|nr:ABC transporter permease [Acidimicrobiaceae bacterium]